MFHFHSVDLHLLSIVWLLGRFAWLPSPEAFSTGSEEEEERKTTEERHQNSNR